LINKLKLIDLIIDNLNIGFIVFIIFLII
jgi:hypothetical protein